MNKKSWIIPLVVLLAATGLLFGIAGHWTGWQGSRPDQETDDAYLKADMTLLRKQPAACSGYIDARPSSAKHESI